MADENITNQVPQVSAPSDAPPQIDQAEMSKQIDELPADVRENLLDGSDQVFVAAYKSAMSDGLDQEAAKRVAWTTIEHSFEKGSDGKWHRRSGDPGIHNKQITTGGN